MRGGRCSLSERERLTAALGGMATVYPSIGEQYEGGVSKCWDEDEWARGAYAWFEPGQMMTLMPHIASRRASAFRRGPRVLIAGMDRGRAGVRGAGAARDRGGSGLTAETGTRA